MAYNNHASAFFLIALILFATANPLAHGLVPGLVDLTVNGTLFCTASGNSPGEGVPGVDVGLNCSTALGVSTQVGQGTTNHAGVFTISAVIPSGQTNQILLPCSAVVNVPLNRTVCPVLSTVNGILVGVVQPVIRNVTGSVRVNATVAGFIFVRI